MPNLSADWLAFENKLAEVLEVLEEDQFLVISTKRGWGYVQFAAQGSFGLRIEAVSNHYLPEDAQLDAAQLEALLALGWSPPATGSNLRGL